VSGARQGEFTGRHMLLVTCGFFAVIIGVNVVMAVSAARTWTGLVVANSYVESQLFQEKHDRAEAQAEAGWRYALAYRAGSIVFSAEDRRGGTLALGEVAAFVRRPVGGHEDQTLVLSPTGAGYAAEVALPPGVWDVTVTTGDTPLGPIAFERRVTVP